MEHIQTIRQTLNHLSIRLDHLRKLYSQDDYESFLRFQVRIIPQLLLAERCSIFLPDPSRERIWLKFGTGLTEKQIEAPMQGSIVGRVVATGESALENELESRNGYHTKVDSKTGFITRNLICAPIRSLVSGEVAGAIQVLNKLGGSDFTTEDLHLLEECGRHLALALENIVVRQEISIISGQLSHEVEKFQEVRSGRNELIASSRSMREVVSLARMVSATPVNVFIQGENGTGKELIARLIHETSGRRNKPFVPVNCASIPETLIESEFFGYVKGAFTGADGSRKGRFEEAEGGTLFLDEVSEMPLAIQAKFLRAIQEREGVRLGSNKIISYDFRLISAANRDVRKMVDLGLFREDLFYRLYSVEITIPPLRERPEDILPLALAFLEETQRHFNKWVSGFSREVIAVFEKYAWPGNVRQLRQEVERLVALTPEGGETSLGAASPALRRFPRMNPHFNFFADDEELEGDLPKRINHLEARLIQEALQAHGGNKVKAAAQLGITRQGLYKKMKRFGL